MPQVNGDNLLHQQIVKRTIEALQAQDEAFAIEYETASDADLIAYVRQCYEMRRLRANHRMSKITVAKIVNME